MEKLKLELKELIVEVLKLQDIAPGDIGDDEPLFVEGLGLDSIDALELSVALEKKYRIKMDDEKRAKAAFASINSLTDFIAKETAESCSEGA